MKQKRHFIITEEKKEGTKDTKRSVVNV